MNSSSPVVQSLRARLQHGVTWSLVATLFGQGITLLLNIIAARLLKKAVFGEYAIVQSTLVTLAQVAQVGVPYSIARYLAEYRAKDRTKAGRLVGLCSLASTGMAIVAALAFALLSGWIAGTVLGAPHLQPLLLIGSAFLLCSAISGYQGGALSGLEAYRPLGLASVGSGILTLVAVTAGLAWWGLTGAVVGLALGALLRCLLQKRFLRLELARQGITQSLAGAREEMSVVTRFSIPAAICGYFSLPAIWLANAILVRQPGGFEEMAAFAVANNVRMLVLLLPNILNNVGLSILNHAKGREDHRQYQRVFRTNLLLVSGSAVAVALFFSFTAEPILHIFGKQFTGERWVLWTLLLATIPESIALALYQRIQSSGTMWSALFFISMPREPTLVLAAVWLVPRFGAVGLALAYLVAQTLGLICTALTVHRLRSRDDHWLRSDAAPVGAMAGVGKT